MLLVASLNGHVSGSKVHLARFWSNLEWSVQEFSEILRLDVEYDSVDVKTLTATGNGEVRQCSRLVQSGDCQLRYSSVVCMRLAKHTPRSERACLLSHPRRWSS